VSVVELRKLRGGYYTPAALASWLTNWAVQRKSATVLEPSCGDGAFVGPVLRQLVHLGASGAGAIKQLTAIEIHLEESLKAKRLSANVLDGFPARIECCDFFLWSLRNNGVRFDTVVGNPPFVRYQNFPEPSRTLAMSLMKSSGLVPNRLTNIWVPFVVAAVNHLAPGGRLAMVLPAELLQVSYAAQLRAFLVDRFARIELVSCNDLVFEHAEQEVVLLLGESRLVSSSQDNRCNIGMIEAQALNEVLRHQPMRGKSLNKSVNHDSEKWLKYFLNAAEISFLRSLRRHPCVACLSKHAEVDVGVVTGRNEFFVLSQSQVSDLELGEATIPLVGRSAQLRGAVIEKRELNQLARDGDRVHLLAIDRNANGNLPASIRRYIKLGESQGIHNGYKCSVRKPWYSVPAIWHPDYFFFRQIYDFPRVVVNRAKATSTDTIHRMRCTHGDVDILAASLYTYLTAASAEIEGRSYGGGVLELEPTEAERLLVPGVPNGGIGIQEIDSLIRQKRLDDALEENSNAILIGQIGLTPRECRMLRRIWQKMRDRRMKRKKVTSSAEATQRNGHCSAILQTQKTFRFSDLNRRAASPRR
jgi:adenine-specific DNA-methyltransferase